jgi:hypothetical protein
MWARQKAREGANEGDGRGGRAIRGHTDDIGDEEAEGGGGGGGLGEQQKCRGGELFIA